MTSPYHLLVADDDASLRETLLLALESQGYWISTAGSGEEAIEVARRHFVHCAILDYRMGDMTGLQLLDALRATIRLPSSILLTAELEKSLQARAERAGFSECLKKPVTPEQLRSSVASVLRQFAPESEQK